jgi:hypothetical protein
VTVEVPEAEYYRLPARLQEKLRVYSGGFARTAPDRGLIIFELADERWDEIVAEMAQVLTLAGPPARPEP